MATENNTEKTVDQTIPEKPKKGKSGKQPSPATDVVPAPVKNIKSTLEAVGKAAIKRHGLDEVFVTSDGLAFPMRCDAVGHAANLENKEIIKVTK